MTDIPRRRGYTVVMQAPRRMGKREAQEFLVAEMLKLNPRATIYRADGEGGIRVEKHVEELGPLQLPPPAKKP